MKKTLIGLFVIAFVGWLECYLIGGLNGLTILALPLTMFLGFNALEKLEEQWKKNEQNEQNENETTK